MRGDRELRRFRAEGLVANAAARVYQLIERIELYSLWVPHLIDSYALTEGPLHTGSRLVFHLAILKVRLRLEAVVTRVDKDSLIAFRSVAGPSLSGQWQLSPEGASTRVALSMEFRLPGGPIGVATRFVDVEAILAEGAARALAGFRNLAERSEVPAAPDGRPSNRPGYE